LKRFIQRELETKIGRAIIAGDVIPGGTIHVDVKSGELSFRTDNPS
jgi:ATP-dependent Clp protease ATP-binding subunit ClpB